MSITDAWNAKSAGGPLAFLRSLRVSSGRLGPADRVEPTLRPVGSKLYHLRIQREQLAAEHNMAKMAANTQRISSTAKQLLAVTNEILKIEQGRK